MGRQRQQLRIIFRNPNQRAMLKCALRSSANDKRSRESSSRSSTPPPTTSELSPTLSALVRRLRRLEQLDPITLASVVRFVEQEVGEGADETRARLPFDDGSPST